MPKIPQVYSQVGLPDAGMSSARLQAPRGEGSGNASLGQDMQSIANLYPSFLAGQAQRDHIAAQEATFRRHLQAGAEVIASRGALSRMVQDTLGKLDQSGDYSSIEVEGEDGSTQRMDPQAYMSKQLGKAYAEQVNGLLGKYHDAGMAAEVGNELEKEAVASLSYFSTTLLKKRIESGAAELDQQLAFRLSRASDPTNPNRDQDELAGLALITSAERAGMLAGPDAAQAKRATFQEAIHDTRWSIIAKTDPKRIQQIAAEVGNKVPDSLPMGMDPKQLPKYVDLANGTLSTQYNQHEQATKLQEEQRKEKENTAVKSLQIKALTDDITPDIIEQESLWSPGVQESLLKINHENTQSRRRDFTDEQRMGSKVSAAQLIEQANLSKFDPALLGPSGTVSEAVVRRKMLAGEMHPDDAKPVLEAIDSARLYLAREDGTVQRSRRDAMKFLEDVFISNPLVGGIETVELKNLENAAKVQLMSALEAKADPNQSDMEVAIELASKYDERLVTLQHRSALKVKRELLSFEDSFPAGTFKPDHVMDTAARKKIEQLPLMRALLRRYDGLAETWRRMHELEGAP